MSAVCTVLFEEAERVAGCVLFLHILTAVYFTSHSHDVNE